VTKILSISMKTTRIKKVCCLEGNVNFEIEVFLRILSLDSIDFVSTVINVFVYFSRSGQIIIIKKKKTI